MGRFIPTPWIVLAGTGTLWVAGLVALGLLGESPPHGWRVNRLLDEVMAGSAARAAEELDRLALQRPDDRGLWLRAGRALVAAGRATDGADRLEHAVALDPASITTRYEWVKALMVSGFDDQAEKELQALLERNPGHADALFLAAALAAGRGDAGLAASRFEAALGAGCSAPERWREEPRFDGVRADRRFLRVARDVRYAAAFDAVRP